MWGPSAAAGLPAYWCAVLRCAAAHLGAVLKASKGADVFGTPPAQQTPAVGLKATATKAGATKQQSHGHGAALPTRVNAQHWVELSRHNSYAGYAGRHGRARRRAHSPIKTRGSQSVSGTGMQWSYQHTQHTQSRLPSSSTSQQAHAMLGC